MATEILQDRFERSCRLCAQEQEVTVLIFSVEAEKLLLQNKLNKYLLIEVDENDKLPKNICLPCCTKLQTVCDFIEMAQRSQEVLLNRSIILDQLTTQIVPDPAKELDHKSLEQSYFNEEASVDELEVSVDPSLILQNAEGLTSPTGYGHHENYEDVTSLHGLDGENVTIKLIKRGALEMESISPNKDVLKPFPCMVCNRAFFSELALKNHVWIHSKETSPIKDYKCYSCDRMFEMKNDLIGHLKQHRISVTCKICGRMFRSEANLALHVESHSSPGSAFICKVCGRSYNTSSNLRTHSITHSNDRPFECGICKKTFKRNQDLKFHINQHTGAKPYKCPFCEKSFASSGNCYSHRSRMHPGKHAESKPRTGRAQKRTVVVSRENVPVRTASSKMQPLSSLKGIYRYQCKLCDHSFMKRDNFTYHMYQHTGEKPFHCTICPEKFVTRRGLLFHHDKRHAARERPLALISKNVLLK